jgi:UDP-N-acetylmuramate: L-alanyl-gamma-D-glutamyl-meso-diaminopimelate ligase|tara:strand:- start:49152 stop:50522 length:1371 start_codon:yes stop_codon:yes gene_type:complete
VQKTNPKKIHLISIGGSIMHDLAINLKTTGNIITGSDDKIYNPAKKNLKTYNILPDKIGYFKNNINKNIDYVIAGMHTKKNNVELKEAKKLNIPILSYPEFIQNLSINKQRIVIAGSHGKTTITSIIMHILKFYNKKFDYLIGGKVNGFKRNVKLSSNPIIILEGDEYLTSPFDKKPKFLNYNHHIVLINGIEWDHFNVFKTFKIYLKQFEKLIESTPKAGEIIYYENDKNILKILNKYKKEDVTHTSYNELPFKIKYNKTYLEYEGKQVPIKIFGRHNMQNLAGAKKILNNLGISNKLFFRAIKTFKLPNQRLEILYNKNNRKVFKDFAHSPSKLKSTINAVKKQYNNKLLSIYELHSSSSLNKDFLPTYSNSTIESDNTFIYISDKILLEQNIEKISTLDIKKYFNSSSLKVCRNKKKLLQNISNVKFKNHNFLFMSSGNFDQFSFKDFLKKIK